MMRWRQSASSVVAAAAAAATDASVGVPSPLLLAVLVAECRPEPVPAPNPQATHCAASALTFVQRHYICILATWCSIEIEAPSIACRHWLYDVAETNNKIVQQPLLSCSWSMWRSHCITSAAGAPAGRVGRRRMLRVARRGAGINIEILNYQLTALQGHARAGAPAGRVGRRRMLRMAQPSVVPEEILTPIKLNN